MNWRQCCFAIVTTLLISAIGCRGRHELETAHTEGTVTLDGKPLKQGTVTFIPKGGRAASGQI